MKTQFLSWTLALSTGALMTLPAAANCQGGRIDIDKSQLQAIYGTNRLSDMTIDLMSLFGLRHPSCFGATIRSMEIEIKRLSGREKSSMTLYTNGYESDRDEITNDDDSKTYDLKLRGADRIGTQLTQMQLQFVGGNSVQRIQINIDGATATRTEYLGSTFALSRWVERRVILADGRGPFTALQLRAKGDDVRIVGIQITFGNGEVQSVGTFNLSQAMQGVRINLNGGRRNIRSIEVVANSVWHGGSVEVVGIRF